MVNFVRIVNTIVNTQLDYWVAKFISVEKWNLQKTQIPIKTHNWDVTQAGFLEADTVAHCGNSLSGEFIWRY
jgi:hypothetical protein